MMRRRNRILTAVVLLAALVVLSVWLMGRGWIEREIKTALAARGMEEITFSIDTLGLRGITFKDIHFGETPLTLDRLTIDYSILELLKKQVRELKVDRLQMKQGKVNIALENVLLKFENAEKGSWQGKWTAEKLEIENSPLPMPFMAGEGTFLLKDKDSNLKGEFKSEDGSHRVAFAANPKQVTVTSAALPWKGGRLATHNAVFSIGEKSGRLNLELNHVSLDTLLKLATNDKAKATGAMSGTIPVYIEPGGILRFGSGTLKADDGGTITMDPEAIPGNNKQVALVRDVMADFRYHQLSAAVQSGQNDKLSILLQLSGNNPNVYNGREVKLNVNLTGDVLSLLQQSIMPITNPSQLLRQDHATP
jgi:hypothetical protein